MQRPSLLLVGKLCLESGRCIIGHICRLSLGRLDHSSIGASQNLECRRSPGFFVALGNDDGTESRGGGDVTGYEALLLRNDRGGIGTSVEAIVSPTLARQQGGIFVVDSLRGVDGSQVVIGGFSDSHRQRE
jgi:hypothetical protein